MPIPATVIFKFASEAKEVDLMDPTDVAALRVSALRKGCSVP